MFNFQIFFVVSDPSDTFLNESIQCPMGNDHFFILITAVFGNFILSLLKQYEAERGW